MKILIISEEFGNTANGLVVENIAKGLCDKADLNIITACYKPIDNGPGNVVVRKIINKTKIQTISIKYLGLDIQSHHWPLVLPNRIKENYDLILSVASMWHYAPLRAGWRIRKKYGGKYFVYFVDAVPAPKPFLKDQKYIDQLSKYIKNYCDNVDIVFSATEEMSKYQSTIINNPNIIFCELYNPSKTNNLVFFTDKSKELAFTYTGNIYPPRNPRYLLDAFARFLKLYPNANLNIIGNNIANYFDSFLKDYPKSVQKQICILPFKKDLSTAFNNSTALIDLGCEVENDVYMSNKINGYFSYCRPIICETSQNSPAARVFKELSSVIICNHNSDEIYNAMMKVISDDYIVDYTERYRILKEMSINGVAQKILDLYNEQ